MKSHSILTEAEAREKLSRMGQSHLMSQWDSLSSEERDYLLSQISSLKEPLFGRQQSALISSQTQEVAHTPFTDFEERNQEGGDALLGKELRGQGKCAVLYIAGGQGSRLRCKGPKGCTPLTVTKQKSLYQLAVEKVKAASDQVGRPLSMGLMTSPLNYVETETFFVQHAFFGLDPSQLSIFYQGMWPFLDFDKNLFLETPSRIAMGPNGNGSLLKRLVATGVFEKWKEQGVESVTVVPIDNPLADPFDDLLLGYHKRMGNEVSIKTAKRQSLDEDVGLIIKSDSKTEIVEYSELSEADRKDPSHLCANLGIFCFSMDFIEKVALEPLPLHREKKAVKQLGPDEETHLPEEPNAWKFELFLFDLLPWSDHVGALLYPREECFAPLKNFKGEASIETVQRALQARDREVFAHISGTTPPPKATFELAQEFHYPTEELLAKWKGRELPVENYIEAL